MYIHKFGENKLEVSNDINILKFNNLMFEEPPIL